ncbi:MAG: HAD family phosphatase [Chloroflexi bacterium]|nr:HAD family phosphatase [Chloroflexota bacterium]MBP8055653.1 HAD family phosphatase [Chloroflexota bacterium]
MTQPKTNNGPVIRAVIFDVGGVLVRTMDRRGRDALEARLHLAPGEAENIVFNSEMGQKAQRGVITTSQLWQWIGEYLGLDAAALQQFQRDFWGGDRMDVALVAYIRELRPRYQTAIISNALDNLTHVITTLYPMADAFDLIVGSAYEKVMKPDALIFERTLERLGVRPQEAIFIDDFAHNLAGARAVGLHTLHFQPGVDVPQALAEMGVHPEPPT